MFFQLYLKSVKAADDLDKQASCVVTVTTDILVT